jgi:RNA recognition motif-containing protein
MNQLKISIVSALKSKSDRGLRLSALKKQCLNDNTTNQISSGDFDKALHALMSKKKIVMKDGIYFFQSKDAKNESDEKIVKNKRKRDSVEEVEENGSDEKNAHVTKKGISKSSVSKESESESLPYEKPKDLWKTGEQAWRDGTIAPQYLLDNPDGITRLFVGNLNKNITEEQLKSCIEGITFIKWITDKSTGQFYGSTFVEMKDKKSAIEAVMKDRQKFMGR